MGKIPANNILTVTLKNKKVGIEEILHEFPSDGWSRSGFHGLLTQTGARR